MTTTSGTKVAAPGASTDAVLAALERIEGRLERLERTMAQVEKVAAVGEQLPATMGILLDSADDVFSRIQAAGIDLDERARVLLRVAERLTAPEALEAVQALLGKLGSLHAVLESGVLDPPAVSVVARAAGALTAAAEAAPAPVGPWGAFRAMGDPEVQRALGFLLHVAKGFGHNLEERPLLPAAE